IRILRRSGNRSAKEHDSEASGRGRSETQMQVAQEDLRRPSLEIDGNSQGVDSGKALLAGKFAACASCNGNPRRVTMQMRMDSGSHKSRHESGQQLSRLEPDRAASDADPAAQRSRFPAVYGVLQDAIAAHAFPGCAFGVLAGG